MNEMRRLMEAIDRIEHPSKDRTKTEMTTPEVVEIGKQYGLDKDGVMKAFIVADAEKKNDFWTMELELRSPDGKVLGRYPNIQAIPLSVQDPDTGETIDSDMDNIHVIYKTNPADVHEMFKWFKDYEHQFDTNRFFTQELETNPFEGLKEAGEIEYLKMPDDYKPAPKKETHPLDKYDWTMYIQDDTLSMMHSLIHKMQSQNVWDKGVELAGGEEELLRSVQYEAEDIMDSYRDSGEGIGTSDMNHFVRSIFRDLGEDDIWGWDKPKVEEARTMKQMSDDERREAYEIAKEVASNLKGMDKNEAIALVAQKANINKQYARNLFMNALENSFAFTKRMGKLAGNGPLKGDEEMERDKAVRAMRANKAMRGLEGLGESNNEARRLAKRLIKIDNVDLRTSTQGKYNARQDKKMQIWSKAKELGIRDELKAELKNLRGINEAKGKRVSVPDELSNPDPKNPKATSADAEAFLHALGPDDEVDDYVVDPETGEVLFEPFMTKRGEGMDKFKSAREYHDNKETWVPSIYGANNQDDAWEELGDLKAGNNNAARFYNIVWRNLGDLLGDTRDLGADVDDWAELDYDVEYDVPVAIKRKDGKKMQEEDYDNFRTLASLIKHATGNISLSMMGTTDKGTVARFTPTLM